MTAALALAACSFTPKYLNPVELYRSAAGFSLNDDTSGERNAQNLEAGSRQPYPNLGTVPPPPDRAMSSIDRQKLQQGLAEDRAQARQTDAGLRDGAASATDAPRPITRPEAPRADVAAVDSKAGADAPRATGPSDASKTRHRRSPGSELAPQEATLTSPGVHTMPEGDTPRAAPPPPHLAPPETARQTARSLPAPSNRAVRAPNQTAAVDTKSTLAVPDAKPSSGATNTQAAAPARGAASSSTKSADHAPQVPPPPPADMMAPAPGNSAAAGPTPPGPPAVAAPSSADTTGAAGAPKAPPAPSSTPATSWPPPLGPSDVPKSPAEQSAALEAIRPAQQQVPPAPGATMAPSAATAPADHAPQVPPPPPAEMMAPAPGKSVAAAAAPLAPPPVTAAPPADTTGVAAAPKAPAGSASTAADSTPTAPSPPSLGPRDTPQTPSERSAAPAQQQAALMPPTQAMPRAPEPEPAAALPPPRPNRAGIVSMQAAEIKFADNGLTLTADDDRRLADVVKLYDKHGGVVRVVGYGRRGYGADAAQQELASFSKAIERANVVAHALTQLGLAANRIVVQAAPIGDGLGEDRAEVLLEF